MNTTHQPQSDPVDARIRSAVAELVATAPPPKPLPVSAVVTRSASSFVTPRRLAAAAAVVMIVAGVVGVAAWRINRDGSVGVATLPPATTPATSPNTPPTSSATPATEPTVSEPSTSEPQTATTDQPLPTSEAPPSLPEPPAGSVIVDAVEALPAGTFQVGADDVFATRVDGDLWWYPGALGDAPGEPVRVMDLGDPREVVTEGPAPNVIQSVAGPVAGVMIVADCCEPASGNVSLLSAPLPTELTFGLPGYTAVLDPTRTRLATVNQFGLSVRPVDAGAFVSRSFDSFDGGYRERVVWSQDGTSLFVLGFDDETWMLERYSADETLTLLARATVDVPSPVRTGEFDVADLAGVDPLGNIVVAVESGGGASELRSFDPVSLQPTAGQWDRVGESDQHDFRLVDFGQSLLWTEGDQLVFESTSETQPRLILQGVIAGWAPLR